MMASNTVAKKSYVVLLSDGDSNWPDDLWKRAGLKNRAVMYNFLYYPKAA